MTNAQHEKVANCSVAAGVAELVESAYHDDSYTFAGGRRAAYLRRIPGYSGVGLEAIFMETATPGAFQEKHRNTLQR